MSRQAHPADDITGTGRDAPVPGVKGQLTLDVPRTGGCKMPTVTQTAGTQPGLTGACSPALFCSGLQPSDAPTAAMVATAISRAVQRFGIDGCAGRMAQEFGDHPDAAASRMRWVRQLITQRPAARRQLAA